MDTTTESKEPQELTRKKVDGKWKHWPPHHIGDKVDESKEASNNGS